MGEIEREQSVFDKKAKLIWLDYQQENVTLFHIYLSLKRKQYPEKDIPKEVH